MFALVTGGRGFIGSHLVDSLVAEGWEVRVLARDKSARRQWKSEAEIVVGDVRDLDSLRTAISEVDVVFHLAARVTDWGCWQDFHDATVVGTCNVLQAAEEARISRFVHFSTVNVYDDRFARTHTPRSPL